MPPPNASEWLFPVYRSLDYEQLKMYSRSYDRLISLLSSATSKPQRGLGGTFLALDGFRYNILPERIATRRSEALKERGRTKGSKSQPDSIEWQEENHGWINLEELQQVMEWKLRRGKDRPTLRALIARNSDDLVVTLSRRAFALFEGREIIGPGDPYTYTLARILLCGIQGVGPATASLILSIAFPREAPFFSDELYTWAVAMKEKSQDEAKQEQAKVLQGGDARKLKKIAPSIKYTPKEYMELCESIIELQKRIHSEGTESGDKDVSATDIERAAYVIMRSDEVSSDFKWYQNENQISERTASPERDPEEVGEKRKRGNESKRDIIKNAKAKRGRGASPKARRDMPKRAAKGKAAWKLRE